MANMQKEIVLANCKEDFEIANLQKEGIWGCKLIKGRDLSLQTCKKKGIWTCRLVKGTNLNFVYEDGVEIWSWDFALWQEDVSINNLQLSCWKDSCREKYLHMPWTPQQQPFSFIRDDLLWHPKCVGVKTTESLYEVYNSYNSSTQILGSLPPSLQTCTQIVVFLKAVVMYLPPALCVSHFAPQ